MLNSKISVHLFIFIITLLVESVISANAVDDHNFKAVVLGSGGGPYENNLSSYLISPSDDNNYIALDAGTILHGLNIANTKKSFDDINFPKNSAVKPEIHILQYSIKAFLITHPHLDHISGLITSSPYDINKNIYGLPATIDSISNNIFNWQIWPNFGNQGIHPFLNKYTYIKMSPGREYSINGSPMKIKAYSLSHSGNYLSTAFLIKSNEQYILYLGDTGPDKLEKSDKLKKLWYNVAPLISTKKLSAIFIECSFTSSRPDNMLYGHLTPRWLVYELNNLSSAVNEVSPGNALDGLPVVVTHIKQSPENNFDSKAMIYSELKKINNIGVKFIIPEQGDRLLF